ncbi:MAG: serine/threonine protein kinase [Solirubrobacterales bacterium]|nr:serine/threonine protein kinase [Solirubrobacterales bacterium]
MSASQLPTVRRARTRARRTRISGGEEELVLGRYRLQRRLGAGGCGTVWQARDERLEREVAVKIVPGERVVGGRFEREACVAARLLHPGIVTLYEAVIDDQGAYLVCELVRGHTLGELLSTGRLSDRDIVAIGIALCDALAHAHAEGVVHRDVKPANVLVPSDPSTPAQIAKLTDFGVARVVGGDSLTRTGDVVGTAAYMAPEQAEGREAGPPADVYALALVIYEALTGVNPLRSVAAGETGRRLRVHLPPLRRQRRELPRELGRGIDLALRPRARERGTIEELRRALSDSREQLNDTPGVVASPWQRLTDLRAAQQRVGRSEWHQDTEELEEAPAARAVTQPAWPARAAAAVTSAVLTAWLAAHLLVPFPFTPAAAGLLAAGLVLTLPRAGWLTAAALLACGAALEQHPGGAALILIGALVPVLLSARRATDWPLAGVALGLSVIGVGGAWPALAGRARSAWRRAALGATGWIWLVLATPLTGPTPYLHPSPSIPAPQVWTASLQPALHDVIWPLLSSGVLLGAAVWALAALMLPWAVRRRVLALDLVRVILWSAVVWLATVAVVRYTHVLGTSAVALIGALAGGSAAIAPWIRASPGLRLESASP